MPGKVAKGHEKQEPECTNCHDRTLKTPQSALCLACHKEIAADIREKHGYHGHMPNSGVGECSVCHVEHRGRDADIVQLDTTLFDHRQTDFALDGAHGPLACAGCHKSGEPWRKVAHGCYGCHKADDLHQHQLAEDCGQCHRTSSWAEPKYDHGKTGFALDGAHQSVTCNACHLGGHYKDTPKTCVGCHKTDDAHRAARGDDCGKCHTTTDWKTAKYNHLKETGYALLGVHIKVDCAACHTSGNFKTKIPKDCFGCHRADDSHANRFGNKCEDCHGNDKWKPVDYDHLVKAKYALLGAHAKIGCHVCHTAVVAAQKLGKECTSCHRSEDPHGGSVKAACDTCHGQTSWKSDLTFDHELTDFPLVGLHAVVSCAQCHRTEGFGRAPLTCVECHTHEDVHKGGLGKKCETCHTPNGWKLWEFDHAKQTGFALTGVHAKNKCADCHREPPGTHKMNRQCIACHRQDDRHLGAYGAQCDRCHTTFSWKGARVQ